MGETSRRRLQKDERRPISSWKKDPPNGLPEKTLPSWKQLPLYCKLPMVPGLTENIQLTRRPMQNPLFLKSPSKDFDLTDPYNRYSIPSTYNALHDPHARQFFKCKDRIKLVEKQRLVTPKGEVVCSLREFNEYRLYLHRLKVQQEKERFRQETEEAKRKKEKEEWQRKKNKERERIADANFISPKRMKEKQEKVLHERRAKILMRQRELEEKRSNCNSSQLTNRSVDRNRQWFDKVQRTKEHQKLELLQRKRLLLKKLEQEENGKTRIEIQKQLLEIQRRQKAENFWEQKVQFQLMNMKKEEEKAKEREIKRQQQIQEYKLKMMKKWQEMEGSARNLNSEPHVLLEGILHTFSLQSHLPNPIEANSSSRPSEFSMKPSSIDEEPENHPHISLESATSGEFYRLGNTNVFLHWKADSHSAKPNPDLIAEILGKDDCPLPMSIDTVVDRLLMWTEKEAAASLCSDSKEVLQVLSQSTVEDCCAQLLCAVKTQCDHNHSTETELEALYLTIDRILQKIFAKLRSQIFDFIQEQEISLLNRSYALSEEKIASILTKPAIRGLILLLEEELKKMSSSVGKLEHETNTTKNSSQVRRMILQSSASIVESLISLLQRGKYSPLKKVISLPTLRERSEESQNASFSSEISAMYYNLLKHEQSTSHSTENAFGIRDDMSTDWIAVSATNCRIQKSLQATENSGYSVLMRNSVQEAHPILNNVSLGKEESHLHNPERQKPLRTSGSLCSILKKPEETEDETVFLFNEESVQDKNEFSLLLNSCSQGRMVQFNMASPDPSRNSSEESAPSDSEWILSKTIGSVRKAKNRDMSDSPYSSPAEEEVQSNGKSPDTTPFTMLRSNQLETDPEGLHTDDLLSQYLHFEEMAIGSSNSFIQPQQKEANIALVAEMKKSFEFFQEKQGKFFCSGTIPLVSSESEAYSSPMGELSVQPSSQSLGESVNTSSYISSSSARTPSKEYLSRYRAPYRTHELRYENTTPFRNEAQRKQQEAASGQWKQPETVNPPCRIDNRLNLQEDTFDATTTPNNFSSESVNSEDLYTIDKVRRVENSEQEKPVSNSKRNLDTGRSTSDSSSSNDVEVGVQILTGSDTVSGTDGIGNISALEGDSGYIRPAPKEGRLALIDENVGEPSSIAEPVPSPLYRRKHTIKATSMPEKLSPFSKIKCISPYFSDGKMFNRRERLTPSLLLRKDLSPCTSSLRLSLLHPNISQPTGQLSAKRARESLLNEVSETYLKADDDEDVKEGTTIVIGSREAYIVPPMSHRIQDVINEDEEFESVEEEAETPVCLSGASCILPKPKKAKTKIISFVLPPGIIKREGHSESSSKSNPAKSSPGSLMRDKSMNSSVVHSSPQSDSAALNRLGIPKSSEKLSEKAPTVRTPPLTPASSTDEPSDENIRKPIRERRRRADLFGNESSDEKSQSYSTSDSDDEFTAVAEMIFAELPPIVRVAAIDDEDDERDMIRPDFEAGLRTFDQEPVPASHSFVQPESKESRISVVTSSQAAAIDEDAVALQSLLVGSMTMSTHSSPYPSISPKDVNQFQAIFKHPASDSQALLERHQITPWKINPNTLAPPSGQFTDKAADEALISAKPTQEFLVMGNGDEKINPPISSGSAVEMNSNPAERGQASPPRLSTIASIASSSHEPSNQQVEQVKIQKQSVKSTSAILRQLLDSVKVKTSRSRESNDDDASDDVDLPVAARSGRTGLLLSVKERGEESVPGRNPPIREEDTVDGFVEVESQIIRPVPKRGSVQVPSVNISSSSITEDKKDAQSLYPTGTVRSSPLTSKRIPDGPTVSSISRSIPSDTKVLIKDGDDPDSLAAPLLSVASSVYRKFTQAKEEYLQMKNKKTATEDSSDVICLAEERFEATPSETSQILMENSGKQKEKATQSVIPIDKQTQQVAISKINTATAERFHLLESNEDGCLHCIVSSPGMTQIVTSSEVRVIQDELISSELLDSKSAKSNQSVFPSSEEEPRNIALSKSFPTGLATASQTDFQSETTQQPQNRESRQTSEEANVKESEETPI